jgi:hypothetical protein
MAKQLAAETVESALIKLRKRWPKKQFIISLRDCGEETQTVRGTSLEYGIQVGMNGQEFDADTLPEALAAALSCGNCG